MADNLRPFNPDDHEAECAREALAELSEVLSLRGMARRNAASEFLSEYEATLRSALSSTDEIARLRAENETLREAVAAERERCARIAERASEVRAFEATLSDDREFVGARLEAADIAAAIRNGERG